MRPILIILSLFSILLLSAFGQITGPITLLNHEQKEVTLPLEKPAVFFFITTYK